MSLEKEQPGAKWLPQGAGPQALVKSFSRNRGLRGAKHALSVPNYYGLSWVTLPNVLCSKNILVKCNSPALGVKGCLAFRSQMQILSHMMC